MSISLSILQPSILSIFDLPCYNFSYYTANFTSYFTDYTIFSFLDGTHTLQGTLEINGVSNITLQGLDNIEQAFHGTVM